MKLVFFSSILNHHQAGVADELYKILGKRYCFVELTSCNDTKGGTADYSQRPYLLRAWQSKDALDIAMHLAITAEVCVFSGCESIPFIKERLRLGLLSFDMGERLLKRGWPNLLSPRIFKQFLTYHLHRWSEKPLYKLCCSAFTAHDCRKLGMFSGRCYKWGYFTPVDSDLEVDIDKEINTPRIMWCARFLTLKHPELVVALAKSLKDSGLDFHIDVFGDDNNVSRHERSFFRTKLEELIKSNQVDDRITLRGRVPNNKIIDELRGHQIFLFTSDKKEGWGAVANESMSNGCVLVASDDIGSTPYLIKDGSNGLVFKSCDSLSLSAKLKWLINHPQEMKQMRLNALKTMKTLWNPHNAAVSLLKLIENIQQGLDTSIEEGPCSKA